MVSRWCDIIGGIWCQAEKVTLWHESFHTRLYHASSWCIILWVVKTLAGRWDLRSFMISGWIDPMFMWQSLWVVVQDWTFHIVRWELPSLIEAGWFKWILVVNGSRLDLSHYDTRVAMLFGISLNQPDVGVTWSGVYGTRLEPSHYDMRVAIHYCIRLNQPELDVTWTITN